MYEEMVQRVLRKCMFLLLCLFLGGATAHAVETTEEVDLQSIPYLVKENGAWKTGTPAWNMGSAQETIYGDGSSAPVSYADVSAYDELRIYQTEGDPVRLFFFNEKSESYVDGSENDYRVQVYATPVEGAGYSTVNLKSIREQYGFARLISIKGHAYATTATVEKITLSNVMNLRSVPYMVLTDGAWNAGTPEWNVANGEQGTIYGAGDTKPVYYADLSDYAELRIYQTTGDPVRVFFFNDKSDEYVPDVGNAADYYKMVNATPASGVDYLVVDLKAIKAEFGFVKLIAIKASAFDAKATVNSILLSKERTGEVSLTFDESGKAYVYPQDMAVTGMTLDPVTGVLKKTAEGSASLTINLGDVDFSNVTRIDVSVDVSAENQYNDLMCRTIVRSQTADIGAWYTNKYGIDYAGYRSGSEHIKEIVMEANVDAVDSMKINYICITKSLVNASAGNEICLKDLPFYRLENGSWVEKNDPGWNMNVDAAEIFGSFFNVQECHSYVDLNDYEEIHVYQTKGNNVLRFWFFNADNTNIEIFYPTIVEGADYRMIDLEEVKAKCGGKAYLTGAKTREGTVMVSNITVTDPNAESDYVLSGYGELNAAAQTALADANATIIDARGITEPMGLVSANPNCLFLVNSASQLSNTKNVVVENVTGMGTNYTCENLELQAGYPFRTPYAFTAAQASTAKTVSEFGTLVLPYAVAALPEGCEAYQLAGVENGRVTGEPLQAIGANAPVLLVGEGDCAFEASDVEVAATPAEASLGALTGVYARTTAPRGSYVLQNQPEVAGMAFYHVESDAVRVNPFTAYLTDAVANAANQNALAIDLNGGVTAVDGVEAAADATVEAIYDLSGRQLDRMAKGVNVVKLSDGTVKKVIVK